MLSQPVVRPAEDKARVFVFVALGEDFEEPPAEFQVSVGLGYSVRVVNLLYVVINFLDFHAQNQTHKQGRVKRRRVRAQEAMMEALDIREMHDFRGDHCISQFEPDGISTYQAENKDFRMARFRLKVFPLFKT